MSRTAPRRWLLTIVASTVCLSVTWAVRAASNPPAPGSSAASSTPASTSAPPSKPATDSNTDWPHYPAAYTAAIKVTGPISPFHDNISHRYNYAFGKDSPFLPSNAMSYNGQFLSPRSFPTAEYCGHCHKAAYAEWRQSVHSNSFRQPWYLKNVNLLIDERGVQFSRHCEGCHNPVALFSGDLSQGMPIKRPFEQEGITCSTCHSIVSADTTGTGSYVMGPPAVLVDENGAPITRPVSDAEILAHLDRHDKAVMRPLLKTPEFCAACHKAAIPTELDDYKWLRAFSVYDEWQGSSFSRQSPLPFYRKDSVSTCQTCHMPNDTEGADDPGSKDGKFASHRWIAANTLNAAYYKFPDQTTVLVNFLRNGPDRKGTLNVDIFALEKESAAATSTDQVVVAPLGLTRFAVSPGETLTADVVIQNKGIGHSLVPEQRDFYEAWVDFAVKDPSGKTICESGFIQPDGYLDPSAHSFTNRLINVKGTLNGLHEIWHNRVLAYNNTIQSGRSQVVRYRFRLPKNARGKFTITAAVKYRRFNQRFVDYAMTGDPTMPAGKHYPLPIVEMASETRTINIGDNLPVPPSPDENPEWMRWNNYGIALLDAQQYQAAVRAFEQVATLRPDYADAFTNMAVVEISWERYDDAKANLARALQILPGDPRALYYRALVERNAGQVDEAIADFQAMLAKYPRSVDGLRELGFSWFQKRDYAQARDIYLRLQKVDPDNLAAHYSLAIIYRRLGDKQLSSVESEKFADQKPDPTASTYALEFLTKHPEVAAESVTWHLHDLTGDAHGPTQVHYTYIPGGGF